MLGFLLGQRLPMRAIVGVVLAVAGLSTLLHLPYEGNSFAAWQWVSVLADGITGAAVLAFALFAAGVVLGVREML